MKTIKIKNLKRKDFEKWCKEQNKNPERNDVILEYLSNVLGDEKAKEFYGKYQSGEISADDFEVVNLDENDFDEFMKKIEKDFDEMLNEKMGKVEEQELLNVALSIIRLLSIKDKEIEEFINKEFNSLTEMQKKIMAVSCLNSSVGEYFSNFVCSFLCILKNKDEIFKEK